MIGLTVSDNVGAQFTSGNPPGPVLGPCVAWIGPADVAACCDVQLDGGSVELLSTMAVEASMALFEISGRQFTGLCERTVRPCQDGCGCWGSASMGLGPWYWAASTWSVGNWWVNEQGSRCGCNPLSRVRLAGYPVRQIVQVKIDGAVMPEFVGGVRQWRLDGWRDLIRMGTPSPTYERNVWPGCQNLDLDDDHPGTFAVTYKHGVDPPPLGMQAAAQIACQLYLACNGRENQLPAGVTNVDRQGIRIERGLLANWFDRTKPTGLVAVDLFLKAYWPTRTRRRPAVFSPDVQSFAKRVGT